MEPTESDHRLPMRPMFWGVLAVLGWVCFWLLRLQHESMRGQFASLGIEIRHTTLVFIMLGDWLTEFCWVAALLTALIAATPAMIGGYSMSQLFARLARALFWMGLTLLGLLLAIETVLVVKLEVHQEIRDYEYREYREAEPMISEATEAK